MHLGKIALSRLSINDLFSSDQCNSHDAICVILSVLLFQMSNLSFDITCTPVCCHSYLISLPQIGPKYLCAVTFLCHSVTNYKLDKQYLTLIHTMVHGCHFIGISHCETKENS